MIVEIEDRQWKARIARARALADQRPVVEGPLRFYAALAGLQRDLLQKAPHIRPSNDRFAAAVVDLLPQFIEEVAREAPPNLAHGLESLKHDTVEAWVQLLETYWMSGGREPNDVDELRLFVVEAMLQPFAEAWALESARTQTTPSTSPARPTSPTRPTRPTCPTCTGLPGVGIFREAGHGAKRALLCGLCLTEWPAMRLACPACGESQFEKLPVFSAEEFDAARIDACDSCRAYIKTIDLTRDGAAVPLVDDLATLPLDLWARERGYRRTRPNLLRL